MFLGQCSAQLASVQTCATSCSDMRSGHLLSGACNGQVLADMFGKGEERRKERDRERKAQRTQGVAAPQKLLLRFWSSDVM